MTEESDIVGEITATEIDAFLEGDIELDGLTNSLEKMLELMKKTGQAEAKLVITIKNDLSSGTTEEEEQD